MSIESLLLTKINELEKQNELLEKLNIHYQEMFKDWLDDAFEDNLQEFKVEIAKLYAQEFENLKQHVNDYLETKGFTDEI